MTEGWTHEASPFHEGEQTIQERAGVRDRAETLARRVVRDHMPDQHREFYENLPFLVLGSVDDKGRPWASLVAGPRGFMSTPDATHLSLNAVPLPGDPLAHTLQTGAQLGVLGIEPATRRRNRMSGTAINVHDEGFDIEVTQAFGNCPKFIQTRDFNYIEPDARAPFANTEEGTRLDTAAHSLISQADTFFIASSYSDGTNSKANGGDVSHRGGKPGFVQIEDDGSLLFPDFTGNKHFNTLGNLLLNPKAGLTFIDFETKDILFLTGKAETIWEDERLENFQGAERLVRFEVENFIRSKNALPFQITFGEFSPFLNKTGDWPSS
jgi:uncharacterized protein